MENAQVAQRFRELIRALAFSRILEGDQLAGYLRGYREHVQPTEAECRLGVELWWQIRLHATWAYAAYFFDGNARVAPFFPETDRQLRRLADDAWRERFADGLVAAACA